VHHDRNTQLSRGSSPGVVQLPNRRPVPLDVAWHPPFLTPRRSGLHLDACNRAHANLAWWIRPRCHFSCEGGQCKI